MNKLTILAFSATIVAGGAYASGGNPELKTLYKAPPALVSGSEEDLNKVILDVDYDLPLQQTLSGLFAFESSGTDTSPYYGLSEEEDSHIYEFSMPDGTYDFFLSITLGNFEGVAILTLDDVKVDRDMNLELKASSATRRTDIVHIAPDGSLLEFKFNSPEGTVPCAQYMHSFTHGDTLVMMLGLTTDGSSLNYILCNNPNSRFISTRLDIMHSPFGFLSMIIPVDFNKPVCGTDAPGWISAAESFAKTPANSKVEDFHIAQGESDYYYSWSTCLALVDGSIYATAGLGMHDADCPTDKVALWRPAGYDGRYEMLPVPVGCAVRGWDSSVAGLPLRLEADGVRQVGLNMLPFRSVYMSDGSSSVIGPENPDFSGPVPETSLGNCAPMLIIIPEEEYFEFTYTGRHGESMSQSSDYYSIPSIEYWENIFDKSLCDLKFYRDGTLLCNRRYEFPYDTEWGAGGEYRLEISTDNVLVDENVPGFCKAVHTFDSSRDTWIPPTLTSLRIIDGEGVTNDRPATAEGSEVMFTAGRFSYCDNYALKVVYADFEEVECTGVEYAPRGSDAFETLDFKEIGEPVLPGYGNKFSADLGGVTRLSPDGWFDLRISVRDSYGATQTQTLSPAFYIKELAGISDIAAEGSVVSEDAVIFTTDGCRVTSPHSPGIYIIRDASGKTRKLRL